MSINKLIVANPYSDKHIELLDKFEKENGIEYQAHQTLITIRTKMTETEYEEYSKKSNDVDVTILMEENGKVTDSCIIQGARDIKTCNIFFAPLNQKKSRPIISMATDYALSVLGMEEIFVSIISTDKNMINNLETREFESLGEENGYITYLKEKEDQKVNSNLVQLH